MCARPILVEAPTQGLPLYGVDAKRPLHPPGALPDSAPSGRSSGVEHNLAKVGVEGSNPFARSIFRHAGDIWKNGAHRPPTADLFLLVLERRYFGRAQLSHVVDRAIGRADRVRHIDFSVIAGTDERAGMRAQGDCVLPVQPVGAITLRLELIIIAGIGIKDDRVVGTASES